MVPPRLDAVPSAPPAWEAVHSTDHADTQQDYGTDDGRTSRLSWATPAYSVEAVRAEATPLPVAEVIFAEAEVVDTPTPAAQQQLAHPVPRLQLQVRRRVRLPRHLLPRTLWWPAHLDGAPIGVNPDGNLIFNLKFDAALGLPAHTAAACFEGPRELRMLSGGQGHRFRLAGGRWCTQNFLGKFLRGAAKWAPAGAEAHALAFLRQQEAAHLRYTVFKWAAIAAVMMFVLL